MNSVPFVKLIIPHCRKDRDIPIKIVFAHPEEIYGNQLYPDILDHLKHGDTQLEFMTGKIEQDFVTGKPIETIYNSRILTFKEG